MSIRVVCPNGHQLNVRDDLGGKVGLCPRCKARVKVPRRDDGKLSEDAILGILSSGGPIRPPSLDFQEPAVKVEAPQREVEKSSPPKKSCHKCNREILASIHICPHCHTYIAELTDF